MSFTQAQDREALRSLTTSVMSAARPFSQAAIAAPVARTALDGLGGSAWKAETFCLPAASQASADRMLTRPTVGSAPESHTFDGYSSVGKLFFQALDGEQTCTASVINNIKPPKSGTMLTITAAHCVGGTLAREPYADKDFVFAPGWVRGKAPYGKWAIRQIYVNKKWLECPVPLFDCHTDPIYDYAIMIVSPLKGRHIGAVTGGDGLTPRDAASDGWSMMC